ncbi:MAG: PAS domain-containing protein [Prolixibacteraceae bacterium]|nr:PAS domain-containing protein [Prolixibacteraceae bacterium]
MPDSIKKDDGFFVTLQELFDNMLNGFAFHKIVVDENNHPIDYIFLEVNNAFEQLTGFKKDKIIGKPVTKVIPGIESDWIDKYGKVAQKGESIIFENYSMPLDKWFLIKAYSPSYGYFATIFEDITEWKKFDMELQQKNEEIAAQNEELIAQMEEIKQSNEQLVSLNEKLETEKSKNKNYLDVAGVILIVLNRNGEITLANRKASEVLNSPVENIEGKNWFEHFVPKNINNEVKNVFNQLMEGKTELVEFYENPVLSSTGEQKIIAWHNRLLKNANGETEGILSSGEDITARKNAEEKIALTKDFYENIIEGVQDGIWVSDKQDVIYYANHATEEIAGVPVNQITGNCVLKDFPEETIKEFKVSYLKAKNSLEPTWYEVYVKTPAGRDTWQNGWLIPKILDGEYDGMVTTIRDISKRKEAENKLIEYKEHLEEIVKERTSELEEKNKELEEFNQLFVGREFRINELKERIKELENQSK